ncbi:hypothetical protein V6N13_065077 [Hibiscus sabdariffa]|uniref:RNase H type-1 domain-containing protein n=1 Tax=Hibiscus sabdariffa TaxID=183260 RepID=A0ABR2QRU9_9ROSI
MVKLRVLVTFSKSVEMVESLIAELPAVKESRLIFLSSRWKDSQKLVIECDCSCIINWIKQPNKAPTMIKNMSLFSDFLKLDSKRCIRHFSRVMSKDAD